MDLGAIAKEVELEDEGVILPIYKKVGDPYLGPDGVQATITVVGGDSQRVRAADRKAQQRQLNAAKRRREITPEMLAEAAVGKAVAAVIDWSGWETDGKPAPCTPENVRLMLTSAPHILRQVQEGMEAHADFFEEQSRSS